MHSEGLSTNLSQQGQVSARVFFRSAHGGQRSKEQLVATSGRTPPEDQEFSFCRTSQEAWEYYFITNAEMTQKRPGQDDLGAVYQNAAWRVGLEIDSGDTLTINNCVGYGYTRHGNAERHY